MNSNEMKTHRLVSNLQMKAALISSISILFVGGLLSVCCGSEMVLFYLVAISFAVIGGVSAIYSTVKCRNTVLNGSISYLQSVLFGFRFFFLSGMVIALGVYLYLRFHPDFVLNLCQELEQQYQFCVKNGIKMTMSYEELQQSREFLLSQSYYALAINLWFSYLFCGALAALVYSPFIARRR
ncbi:MAG: DUF4199 domain-containing protein [Paludibacteraceae bacterium]|nr:DUF4199 domain-containing protein [Paludibacteraceae bacterium]